nr:3962_t:CDS:2 [Entrophospora candida]CAG8501875.1 2187_t:CDS:2 [Entrophospora candida]
MNGRKESRMISEGERVAIIGSGNWGTVIARIVGDNVKRHKGFDSQVRMWVYEEIIQGRKLTEIINEDHVNVKYLPDYKIPENVVAKPELLDTIDNATVLIFVIPHQANIELFLVHPKAKAITLIKGFDVSETGILPVSETIKDKLCIPVCTLSGANIANEIAAQNFSETTIGCSVLEEGQLFQKIFETDYFRVGIIEDVTGVELCGALKNVIAIGAGIVDGLKMGENAKAAIIRVGFLEMKKFIQMFYHGVKEETFFESCGIADVIATCYGGRNRKVAEAHVLTGKSFEELENELLNGQKLQGTLTAKELYMVLSRKKLESEFKLFTTIYRIAYENLPPEKIVQDI